MTCLKEARILFKYCKKFEWRISFAYMVLIFERGWGGSSPLFRMLKFFVLMCISGFISLHFTHLCGSDLLQFG